MFDSDEEDTLFLQIAVLMRLNKKIKSKKTQILDPTFKLASIKKVASFTFLRYFVNLKVEYKGVLFIFPLFASMIIVLRLTLFHVSSFRRNTRRNSESKCNVFTYIAFFFFSIHFHLLFWR